MDKSASEDKQRNYHNKRCQRGQYRPAECFIYASVNYEFQRILLMFSQIFPDSVKNNNGIIEGISDDREKRGDNRECKLFVKYGKYADSNGDIMDKGNNSSHGIFQFKKPEKQKGYH